MKFLFILLIILPITIFSQNFVPNSSFEDTLWCPTNHAQINAASHWFSPIGGGGGSSEFFHICNCILPALPGYSPGSVCVPNNHFGYQHPHTGNAYSGIVCFWDTTWEYRENIEVKLTNVINPTRTYYTEFYVSLSDKSGWGISNIGAYFSKYKLTDCGYCPGIMNLIPHIEYSGFPIIDTMNWVKISGYFKPEDEGTKYMTIGNFADSGQTTYQQVKFDGSNKAYYYIDDVFVADSVSYVNSLKELEIQKEKIKIYPNPASNKLEIEFNTYAGEFNISFYNILGEEIYKKNIIANSNKFVLNMDKIKTGIYLVKITKDKEIICNEKIVVLK